MVSAVRRNSTGERLSRRHPPGPAMTHRPSGGSQVEHDAAAMRGDAQVHGHRVGLAGVALEDGDRVGERGRGGDGAAACVAVDLGELLPQAAAAAQRAGDRGPVPGDGVGAAVVASDQLVTLKRQPHQHRCLRRRPGVGLAGVLGRPGRWLAGHRGEHVEPVTGLQVVGRVLAGEGFHDLDGRCHAAEPGRHGERVLAARLIAVSHDDHVSAGEIVVVCRLPFARAARVAGSGAARGLDRLDVLLAFGDVDGFPLGYGGE